ncbi:hypothetical protein [Spirilliplanes yamanashiensis]|uniref:Uncharacterized protein n=1 Tax=Spirilliplanes yamanashiensis TaxID=42233 RepID=A0A8J3YF05_9ACTN|nr:hypothetical protein [Spirilliplanes yamanashiensis]MDP9818243.1 hypothetical protein [Spirilliplanes yamanashiensis]GIJ06729.1 hypothetical protein Sya03_60810 [Spirilliplanes yamanashiensis]
MSTIVFPDRAASARHARAEQCLGRAAAAAAKAPLVGGARPWRWHLAGDTAALYLVPGGPAAGPDAHVRDVVDCGSALHHALTALAGEGARAVVCPFPHPGRPDLLATVRVSDLGTATPAAVRAYQAVSLRTRTAALPGRATMPATVRSTLEEAAAVQGARLRVLGARPDGRRSRDALIEAPDDTAGGWLSAGRALSAVALAAAMDRLVVTVAAHLTTGAGAHPAVAVRVSVPGPAGG